MKNKVIFRLGEIFSGPGGVAVGALRASASNQFSDFKIEHVWATDYDRDTCITYQTNISPSNSKTVICEDIRKLDLTRLKQISTIDALAFGFPCNDFSMVGEQKGIDGTFGPLFMYGVEVLKNFQPKWFLAENVAGLKNSNDGVDFKTILTELYNTGYSIYPHLYKFDNYGVPQARQRIIIVGIRKDLDVSFKVPSPDQYSSVDVSCRTAIEFPPISPNASNNEFTRQSTDVIERLKFIKPGENAFTATLPQRLQLKIKGAKISQIYKRLDPNKPAYTITGSGGGGTHVYHWEEHRALTNRERARLQTFPDDFIFHGSKESVRKQIGMAVPCEGIKVIFNAILDSFAGNAYPSVPPVFEPLLHPRHGKLFANCKADHDEACLV